MAKQISTDGYVFDFDSTVVDAFVFDSPAYHGGLAGMKAVDIIAEFPNEYLFIELKKYDPSRGGIVFRCPIWDDKSLIANNCPLANDPRKGEKASIRRIVRDLRQKYCDTFLFRYAENKPRKDVNYICVVEGCDSAQTLRLDEILKQNLPRGKAKPSWNCPIVKNIAVVNVSTWNTSSYLNKYGSCKVV